MISSDDGSTGPTKHSTILICAYAADPSIPSEPTIGWAFVQSALRATFGTEQTVVLLANSRSGVAMEQWATEAGVTDKLKILPVALPKALRWLERPRINFLARLEYLIWFVVASRTVRRLAVTTEISLAHHVTFATEMLPTPIIHAGPQAYKVWGPIGSDGSAAVFKIPPLFEGTKREYFIQRVRDALSARFFKLFARRLDLVITSQKGKLYRSLSKLGVDVFAFPNLVLPDELVSDIRRRAGQRALHRADGISPLRIMCVGHLVPRKRFELAIAMLGQPALKNAVVHFFGAPTGGDLRPYHDLADSLGVRDRIVFNGAVPRTDVLDFMVSADVLFHPAGREGAVGVIGEATTAGIPVVCFSDTGAALVLQAAKGAGVVIDSKKRPTMALLAEAVAEAAAMDRSRSANWTASRFDALEQMLIRHTDRRRDGHRDWSESDSHAEWDELTNLIEIFKHQEERRAREITHLSWSRNTSGRS